MGQLLERLRVILRGPDELDKQLQAVDKAFDRAERQLWMVRVFDRSYWDT